MTAGLGGGSADAAATLRGLNRVWDLGLSTSELLAIALELGADVPVCLFGRSARMRGIGERLEPLELPALDLVLANPRRAVSTARAFAGLGPIGAVQPIRSAPAEEPVGPARLAARMPQRSRGAGAPAGAADRSRARGARPGAGLPPGPDDRERRHVLWRVRRSGRGRARRGRPSPGAPGMVGGEHGEPRAMIVLCTDFGPAGPYVGQVKAVLAREAPGVPVIDLFADLPPFRPQLAAYLLAAYGETFVAGDVILAVVDPGVGSARAALALEADGRWYVGPDNGLFEIVQRRAGAAQCWTIDWRPPAMSATFHGRDLFAPVAARLARGEPPPGTSSGAHAAIPSGRTTSPRSSMSTTTATP